MEQSTEKAERAKAIAARLGRETLAYVALHFADELAETIDAVFLAAEDGGFLTEERKAELLAAQKLAAQAAEEIHLLLDEGSLLDKDVQLDEGEVS